MSNSNPVATWKPIPEWTGAYDASDHGQVRNSRSGRVLKPWVHQDRLYVGLSEGPRQKKNYMVHRLVLITFVGPPPPGMECCHKDGNPANNHVSNLRWGTHTSNMHDLFIHKTCHNANKVLCKFGHPLAPPNLVPCHATPTIVGATRRSCLACSRAHSLRSAARRDGRPLPDMQSTADAYYAEIVASYVPPVIPVQRTAEPVPQLTTE